MPKIEVSEDRILESLGELSPEAQRKALRLLLPSASYVERALERHSRCIETIAAERGLQWDKLSEQQREALIDDLLHE